MCVCVCVHPNSTCLSLYLRVERELVQLQVLEETALDATSLTHGRLAVPRETHRRPRRLARLAHRVLDEQLRVPVLVPVSLGSRLIT